jgi:hypothetical protein
VNPSLFNMIEGDSRLRLKLICFHLNRSRSRKKMTNNAIQMQLNLSSESKPSYMIGPLLLPGGHDATPNTRLC